MVHLSKEMFTLICIYKQTRYLYHIYYICLFYYYSTNVVPDFHVLFKAMLLPLHLGIDILGVT